jgi:inner membrane protein
MDSLTQIALGAATCALVVRQPLRRAMVYGAALGTLPDLDVLVLGHLDPVEQFVRHRSFSHSLPMMTLAAWPLAWLLRRLDPGLRGIHAGRWALAVWLVLVTHALLDAFTVYGTQLWWPLAGAPVSWASVFIIDPLYTLPLLVALVLAWRGPPERVGVRLGVGLMVAQAYLAWGLAAQHHVRAQVAALESARGTEVEALLVTPAPFTSLLWRVLIRTPQGHSEGWYSLLRGDPAHFRPVPIAPRGVGPDAMPSVEALDTLEWFSHGYLMRFEVDGRLRVADLRMGAAPDFFFVFDIAERDGGQWRAITPERVMMERPRMDRLGEVYGRL